MRKNYVILSAAAVLIVAVCCVTLLAISVWQLPSTLNATAIDPVSGNLVSPTPISLPTLDRDPVPTSAPLPTNIPIQTNPTPEGVDTPAPIENTPQPTPANTDTVQLSTEQALRQADLPKRDQRLLAIRLKNGGQDIPETVNQTSPDYQVGQTDTFWVTDNGSEPPRQFQVDATLQYVTDHSYWWVEDGMSANENALQRSAERFENETYPTNREFFGSEWSPGVDNDVRVHVFMGNAPGVAGYYSASNSYSNQAEPYSNEREMFFINLNAISPGNDAFDGVLAHEFQHMIHWNQDRNEDTWVNEGLSELATFLNGYGPSTFVSAFTRVPDTQLNNWSSIPGATLANYGSSFLFMAYFLQQYGEDMMKAVVANPHNGVEGFNAVLTENGNDTHFEDIFADYLIANYLQDTDINNGKWGYDDMSVGAVNLTERHNSYPVEKQTTVYQFGGDYLELTGNGDVNIEFTGSTRVKAVNNNAHSGNFQWYSHRGDDTNTRLTRTFDLNNVDTATLNYWVWFDIESDWDYGYVEISTDGGNTWTILETPHTATTNPSGNAFGSGYTGISGDGPAWVEESIDISDYAGQEVQIRFEYITDDAVNRPGLTIDDISIPEIDFFDDVESGPTGWQAEGFVQIDNVLPQRFLVQLLEFGDEVTVRPLQLDETNYGTLTVEGLGDTVERAVLIVSGLTPVTTEPATYQYSFSYVE